MGLKFHDRVKEPASSSGIADFTMSGVASPSYETVLAGIAVGNWSYFVAWDPVSNAYEVFKGTVSAGTSLSRDEILDGSAGPGVKVNFANAPIIWNDFPASLVARSAAASAITLASMAGAL